MVGCILKKVVLIILILILAGIIIFKPKENAVGAGLALTCPVPDMNQSDIPPAYDYKQYKTVKLLHTVTGEVEEVPLDEYLYGVVAAEMPASYNIEALKAQAVVARTYTIYMIIDGKKFDNADVSDDPNTCQAWISKEDRLAKWNENERDSNWNKITEAVNSTVGKIITYDGSPIDAFFCANNGGKSEIPINVWGGINYPYLQVVATAGEDAYPQYSSEVSISKEELIQKLKQYHNNIQIDFTKDKPIEILSYTLADRVKTVRFGNVEISGVEARTILGLKSADFSFNISGDSVTFNVTGYGHGVGMSQTGADTIAKEGGTYEDIINHFYIGVQIVDI